MLSDILFFTMVFVCLYLIYTNYSSNILLDLFNKTLSFSTNVIDNKKNIKNKNNVIKQITINTNELLSESSQIVDNNSSYDFMSDDTNNLIDEVINQSNQLQQSL